MTAEGRTKRERAGGTVLAESSGIVSPTVERVFKVRSTINIMVDGAGRLPAETSSGS